MASMDDVRRLAPLDNGLATIVTTRSDGTTRATVVNAGVIDHPLSGDPVAAFVARGGTRKLDDLRARPQATLQWRAGWAWVSMEGTVELIGPDDPNDAVDDERLARLLRDVYSAAGGGEHEDWAEYDRVVAAERRAAVLIAPRRIYTNP
jgi:PPOX class probable F420-dependent enzyme